MFPLRQSQELGFTGFLCGIAVSGEITAQTEYLSLLIRDQPKPKSLFDPSLPLESFLSWEKLLRAGWRIDHCAVEELLWFPNAFHSPQELNKKKILLSV